MDWWITVLVLGEMAFLGGVVWIVAQYRHARARLRAEERHRLLERFGTGQELAGFLESGAGEKLLTVLASPPADPARSVAAAVTAGLVLLFSGAGFLILAWLRVFDDPDVFLIPGILGVMAGLGVLASAAVSLRLLRRLPVGGPALDIAR